MDMGYLIARYGLWVVLLGSMLEGESMLVLAGFSAHRGYLDFLSVVVVAWFGAVVGDQFYFWLGRRHGQALLARSPRRARDVQRAIGLIERHQGKVIFAMRFLWGLRTALPIAVGMSAVSRSRFLVLNVLSAAVWAVGIGSVGWLFGEVLSRHIADLQRVEHWVMAGLLVAFAALYTAKRWLERARR